MTVAEQSQPSDPEANFAPRGAMDTLAWNLKTDVKYAKGIERGFNMNYV